VKFEIELRIWFARNFMFNKKRNFSWVMWSILFAKAGFEKIGRFLDL
jgi:hypothetical protein